MVDSLPIGAGASVLDVCTGTTAIARVLVTRRGVHVTGVDRSPDMLAAGRALVARDGLGDRITLVEGDARDLPFADGRFDALTVSYLLRYVDDPLPMLREMARVMAPGAPYAMLEFGVPGWAPARLAFRALTGIGLPVAGFIVGGREWAGTGRFLHRSIPALYARTSLDEILALHAQAGIEPISVLTPSCGGGVIIRGRRDSGGPSG